MFCFCIHFIENVHIRIIWLTLFEHFSRMKGIKKQNVVRNTVSFLDRSTKTNYSAFGGVRWKN